MQGPTFRRIPSLDGLRAISVLLVVSSHLFNQFGVGGTPLHLVFGNGALGVSAFFVLSGYLITKLLIEEREVTGTISLRDFYLRRGLRIFPAYYLLVAVVVALALAGVLTLNGSDVLRALTFTTDYSPAQVWWPLRHSWSLSIEEQFYLLWPGALLVLGRQRALKLALALIVAGPFIRLGQYFWAGNIEYPPVSGMLHTRIDTLMFGCAAALLSGDPRLASVTRTGYRIMFGIGLVAAVLSPILIARFGGAYLYLIGYTVEGACVVLLMLWLTEHPKSGAGVFLNTRGLVHIGVLSYSIYLWQQIFLASDNRTWTGQFPLNLVLAFTAAEISYQVVEKSFLRWRSRLRHTGRPRQKTEKIAQGELPLPQ